MMKTAQEPPPPTCLTQRDRAVLAFTFNEWATRAEQWEGSLSDFADELQRFAEAMTSDYNGDDVDLADRAARYAMGDDSV